MRQNNSAINFQSISVPDDVPVYQVMEGKLFSVDENGNDRLYPEGSIVAFPDEPNTEMKPLNKLAWKNMIKYLEKLDTLGRTKAEKDGVGYVPLKEAFLAAHAPAHNGKAGTALLLNKTRETPIMGSTREGGRVKSIQAEGGVTPIEVVSGSSTINVNDLF